jgi:hypothetical protein
LVEPCPRARRRASKPRSSNDRRVSPRSPHSRCPGIQTSSPTPPSLILDDQQSAGSRRETAARPRERQGAGHWYWPKPGVKQTLDAAPNDATRTPLLESDRIQICPIEAPHALALERDQHSGPPPGQLPHREGQAAVAHPDAASACSVRGKPVARKRRSDPQEPLKDRRRIRLSGPYSCRHRLSCRPCFLPGGHSSNCRPAPARRQNRASVLAQSLLTVGSMEKY